MLTIVCDFCNEFINDNLNEVIFNSNELGHDIFHLCTGCYEEVLASVDSVYTRMKPKSSND